MKVWIKKTFGFGLASLLSDLSHEMTVSLIPVLVSDLVGSVNTPLFLGLLSGVPDACAACLRIFSGFMSDRINRKKPLILTGYFLSALFSALAGYSYSIRSLLFYRIISFAGSGLREPPRDLLIAASVEPAYYGRAFGLKSAMDTLGALIGPLIALICAQYFLPRYIFAFSFIPGIAAVFAILFYTQENASKDTQSDTSVSFFTALGQMPRSFIVFLGIFFILDLGFINKLILLGRTKEMLGEEHAFYLLILLYAIFNASRACSEYCIGRLSDTINRLYLLAAFGCGMLIVVSCMLASDNSSIYFCIFLFIAAGICAATIGTLKKAYAADLLPKTLRGTGFGILQASEGLALLLSGLLIGSLWHSFGSIVAFGFSMAIAMVSATALLLFARTIS